MAETKLSDEEIDVLRTVLRVIVVRQRTGELGIKHGMDRFVSTHCTLRKQQRQTLDSVARKIGISDGISPLEG